MPPPSPTTAPGTTRPPRPARLPALADSFPIGLPAGSVPHSSAPAPRRSTQSAPGSAPPVPRTAREPTNPANRIFQSHSIPPGSAFSPPRPAGLTLISASHFLRRFLSAHLCNVLSIVQSSLLQTSPGYSSHLRLDHNLHLL